ncbi:MAG UNVERIFIED_CONTAM: hypothetical protein LVR18_49415 [Planctomycetaceae bacterium]
MILLYKIADQIRARGTLAPVLKLLARDTLSTPDAIMVLRTPERFDEPEVAGLGCARLLGTVVDADLDHDQAWHGRPTVTVWAKRIREDGDFVEDSEAEGDDGQGQGDTT